MSVSRHHPQGHVDKDSGVPSKVGEALEESKAQIVRDSWTRQ